MTRQNDRHALAREGLIAHAVNTRKIAPDRAGDYRRMFDADPQGTLRLLTAPVRDGGLMAGVAAGEAPSDAPPIDYPTAWLGRRAPAGSVAFEDHGTAVDAAANTVPGPTRPERPQPDDSSRPVPGVTFEP